jgi:hypothetical protein
MRRSLFALLALAVAPLAARAADADHPYKNAKVGDFAVFTITTKLGGITVPGTATQTVTARTEKELTLKTVTVIEGFGKKDPKEKEQKVDLTQPFDPSKAPNVPAGVKITKGKEGTEKLKLGGKEYECAWAAYTATGQANGMDVSLDIKLWTAKGLALGVVKTEVKTEVNGQKVELTMEMKEFGSKK